MSDTIAAIATGNVLSAIGILRLSGDGVLTVIDRVFRPANGRPMSEAPDRKLVYGRAAVPRLAGRAARGTAGAVRRRGAAGAGG